MTDIFSKTIKLLRKNKTLTQAAFAINIGSKQGYISEIERGLKIPGGELLLSLKHAYPNLNLDWLLTGQGEMFLDSDQKNSELIEKTKAVLASNTQHAETLSGNIEGAFRLLELDQEKEGEVGKDPSATGTDSNYGR